MNDDEFVIRVHFTDGTSALSGTLGGGAPDKVDATFARDIDRGWDLGVSGRFVPDGRIIRSVSAEHESGGVRTAA